jgi:predicted DNA binding CopG/RHH family protein
MNQDSEFPFDRARRVTPEEHQHFKAMVAKQLGTQSDANTVLNPEEPYQAVSLQLHPKVLTWAKTEAQKRGIEYQTVINEVLLKQVG